MSTYYHPEDLGPDQDQRDIAIPGRRFFVYVLDTDSGHYVGHTARLNARMREHRGGEVASTAGTNPMLAWQSGPMARRGDAARFEAALKSWLDSGSSMFEETTRLRPKKFLGLTPVLQSGTVRGVPSGAGRRFKLGADHRLRPTTAIGWLMFVAGIFGSLLGLLWAFNFELGALGVGALKVFGLAGACALGLVLVVNGRVLGRWPPSARLAKGVHSEANNYWHHCRGHSWTLMDFWLRPWCARPGNLQGCWTRCRVCTWCRLCDGVFV